MIIQLQDMQRKLQQLMGHALISVLLHNFHRGKLVELFYAKVAILNTLTRKLVSVNALTRELACTIAASNSELV